MTTDVAKQESGGIECSRCGERTDVVNELGFCQRCMQTLAGAPVVGAEVTENASTFEWATAQVGKHLFHRGHGFVGEVVGAIRAGEHKGPNGRPVTAPVLLFKGGHTMVANARAVQELTVEGVTLVNKTAEWIGLVLNRSMRLGGALGIEPEDAIKLLTAVIASQARHLQATELPAREPPVDPLIPDVPGVVPTAPVGDRSPTAYRFSEEEAGPSSDRKREETT